MKLSLGTYVRDYSVAGGVSYDADAQAYFTANTAITSAADKNAINTFYLGLKSDGIYTKIKAMYLPIWGSAASCKWNLVNPLDTNAAFRLTFSTGWTFSSGGMTPTNAYANSFLIPNSHLTNNSTHLSIYSRTNTDIASASFDIGTTNNVSAFLDLSLRLFNNLYADAYNNTTNRILTTNSVSLGFYLNNRTSSTVFKVFKNNAQIGTTNTSASSGFTSLTSSIFIGAINKAGTPDYYTNRQYAFASIGDGLTDTEASNFYNRIQTLMTYFGINV